MIRAHGAG
jgi:hypothetical protein